jgi:hypothetical protein
VANFHLSAAGGRDSAIHAQVFHHLPGVIVGMGHCVDGKLDLLSKNFNIFDCEHRGLNAFSDRFLFSTNYADSSTACLDTPVAWGIVENLLLDLRGNSWWRSNVLKDNEQKEVNDSEGISDREVWSAIHYLDPESDGRKSKIAAAIAVLAIICMLCTVIVYLHEL